MAQRINFLFGNDRGVRVGLFKVEIERVLLVRQTEADVEQLLRRMVQFSSRPVL